MSRRDADAAAALADQLAGPPVTLTRREAAEIVAALEAADRVLADMAQSKIYRLRALADAARARVGTAWALATAAMVQAGLQPTLKGAASDRER